jgi:uncharacterized membrane protein YfcA
MIITYLSLLITGIAVGFVSTIFGIGGGILMVPLISLLLPLTHLEAIATSLAAIVLVASFNTFNFYHKEVIVWKIVPWIAIASSLFAFLSATVSTFLPEKILISFFILFLLNVAIRTLFIKDKPVYQEEKEKHNLLPWGIGTLSGIISGFTGIGGGGITTPLMLITGLVRNVQAAPTSNAIMIFTNFFASLSFATAKVTIANKLVLGYIHIDIAILFFLGSAISSRFGVNLNQKISLTFRKTVLAFLLLFICIRFIFMLFNN